MKHIDTSKITGDQKLADKELTTLYLSADAVVGVFNEAISAVNNLSSLHTEICCVATAVGAHAEGYQTSAMCTAGHSEGQQTVVYPYEIYGMEIDMSAGHAEGYQTSCNAIGGHVEGGTNIVKGQYAHVGGSNCSASGTRSFVHGLSCFDGDKADSIVFGVDAEGRKNSFVWNGDDGYAKVNDGKRYGNQFKLGADGVFAVNPKLGANGFYIGTETLSAIISAAVKAGIEEYKSSLTAG